MIFRPRERFAGMPQNNKSRVAVIGGGVTGLAAMYALAQARNSGAAVEEFLIESGERLGGVIHTEQVEDFVIEAGPDSFLTEKPEGQLLCEELGLGGELIASNDHVRRTYVLHRGRLAPLPRGLMFFAPGRLWPAMLSPLLPIASKAAIVREFFRRPGNKGGIRENENDESVAEFVRRHFGVGLLENIAQPLLAGVYGADPEELSARAALSRFVTFERENGSVIRGALKASKARKDNSPIFTTLRGGLGDLVQALSARLSLGPGQLRCYLGSKVVEISVSEAGRGVASPRRKYAVRCESGSVRDADAVILALPGSESAQLLKPLRSVLCRAVGGIQYAPAVTVALAFRTAPDLPPGFGFLVPRAERARLLACTFVHSKFPFRAPAGGALLRCFLGGSRNPEVLQRTDEEIITAITIELRAMLGLSRQADFYRIFRWRNALPQYSVGHEGWVREIRQQLKELPGIFLAGNAYNGVGVPDCIRSGRAAAEEALRYGAAFG